jgi:hypothetical protein
MKGYMTCFEFDLALWVGFVDADVMEIGPR